MLQSHYPHTLVIRKEFMNEDFENFQMLLRTGKFSNIVAGKDVTRGSANAADDNSSGGTALMKLNSGVKDKKLSLEASTIACQLLCEDIQSYKRFLYRAENLSEEMKRDSIADLKEYCPLESEDINLHCRRDSGD
jgi:hypothetical protein